MPIFKFFSIPTEEILPIANALQVDLAKILNTNIDNITIQMFDADTIMNGEITPKVYPQVEVQLFPRSNEQYQEIAKCVTLYLNEIGYPESDLFFIELSTKTYFENGLPVE